MSDTEIARDIVIAMINNGIMDQKKEKQKEMIEAVCSAISDVSKAMKESH